MNELTWPICSAEHLACTGLLILHGMVLTVAMTNLIIAPRIRRRYITDSVAPHVSILVPARNEAGTIDDCLTSILSQDYPNYSVLVCDDNSTDNTADIVSSLMKKSPALGMISGAPLPSGWTGKNWACHQLSQNSQADILLFIDADCRLSPWALSSAVALMRKRRLALLSSFPTQIMHSWGERLVVPIMEWLLLSFLPLFLVYRSSWLSFVAANGQFMLFDRRAYDTIGGHQSVSSRIVEDMELARLIKGRRLRMLTALGGQAVSCRMYRSYRESVDGFIKNFFTGFNVHPLFFLTMVMVLFTVFFIPFIIAPLVPLLVPVCLLILIQRFILAVAGRQNPLVNMILHPLHMLIMTRIGFISVISTMKKTLQWKGRRLS